MMGRAREFGRNRRGMAAFGFALLAATALIETAAGQEITATSVAQTEPQDAVAFDIPEQPLSSALTAFVTQSGYQVSVDQATVADLRSAAVAGNMTPDEALRRMLAGSGIAFRFADNRSVFLTKAADESGGLTLDPVVVDGTLSQESPIGPDDGYVAKRSETATKTDAALIEVPQSLSVITREQMDDRNARTLNDSLRYSAGVQAGDTNDLTTESFSIRGYNAPFLSLYRDGTRLMFRAFDSVVEPYGLERVEVLRGPASVLYGQGVPGGIVNTISKRPSEERLLEGQVEIGTYDRYQGAFDVGGAVSDDKTLQLRVTALGRKSDTQTDFVPDDRVYVAPGLRWLSPDHGTDLTLFADFQQDWTSFPDGLPAQGTVLDNPNGDIPTNRFVGEPGWSDFERTNASVGYALDQDLGEIFNLYQSLRYTYSIYDRNQVQNRDFNDATLRTIDRRARKATQESNRINIDTRLKAEFGPDYLKNEVTVGVDFGWAQFTTDMSQGGLDPLDLFDPDYGAPVSTPNLLFDDKQTGIQTGLYLQTQTKIAESFILVGGVRHDWSEDKLVDHITSTTIEQDDEATTFRVGAVYLAPYGLAPYASYTTSYVPVFGTDAQGKPFEPETGEQYEVGLKFEPKGFNGSVTVSAFQIVRQNVQTPDPDDIDFLIQTGEVKTRGIEFEAVADITKNFSLQASFSLLDAEVTKSNDVDLGKRPTTVPKTMASLWADYEFDEGPVDGLSFGAGVRYVGNTPGDMENTFFVPSYTVFDAALRYEWNNLKFAVNANNLFDNEYVSTCFALSSCYYGERRSVIGTLTYNW